MCLHFVHGIVRGTDEVDARIPFNSAALVFIQ